MSYTPPRIISPSPNKTSRGPCYCIHGMTADPRELEPLARFLAESGFTVYLPTLLGHEAIEDSNAAKKLGSITLKSWLQQIEWELQSIASLTERKVLVVGMSFGGLLAMHLCQEKTEQVSAVALMSVPIKFRSSVWEVALKIMTALPDVLLPFLGTFPKSPDNIERAFARHRLNSYSIGAAVRLMKLRRRLLSSHWPETIPTVVLHAPEDKIVAPESPLLLREYLGIGEKDLHFFANGSHELAIGLRYQDVQQTIEVWIQEVERSI